MKKLAGGILGLGEGFGPVEEVEEEEEGGQRQRSRGATAHFQPLVLL